MWEREEGEYQDSEREGKSQGEEGLVLEEDGIEGEWAGFRPAIMELGGTGCPSHLEMITLRHGMPWGLPGQNR